MQSLPTVLIVDDHREFRRVVRSILERDYRIIGEAGSGEEALQAFELLHPNAVILDISLPGMNGFEVARRLLSSDSGARIVFCSNRSDPEYVNHGLSIGALGFVSKAKLAQDLVSAVERAILTVRR